MYGGKIHVELMNQFMITEISFISRLPVIKELFTRVNGFSMWMFLFVTLFIVLKFKNVSEIKFKSTVGREIITILFFVWSIVSFSNVSIFLYFNF